MSEVSHHRSMCGEDCCSRFNYCATMGTQQGLGSVENCCGRFNYCATMGTQQGLGSVWQSQEGLVPFMHNTSLASFHGTRPGEVVQIATHQSGVATTKMVKVPRGGPHCTIVYAATSLCESNLAKAAHAVVFSCDENILVDCFWCILPTSIAEFYRQEIRGSRGWSKPNFPSVGSTIFIPCYPVGPHTTDAAICLNSDGYHPEDGSTLTFERWNTTCVLEGVHNLSSIQASNRPKGPAVTEQHLVSSGTPTARDRRRASISLRAPSRYTYV